MSNEDEDDSWESTDKYGDLGKLIEDHAAYIRANHATIFDKEAELERALKGLEGDTHWNPEDLADVKRRMQLAVSKGWSSLGFWVYGWDPRPCDLFGVSPESGYGEFVPMFDGEVTICEGDASP